LVNGDVEREANVASLQVSQSQAGPVYWAGVEDRYFLGAIIPRVQEQGMQVVYGAKPLGGDEHGVFAGVQLARKSVLPGQTIQHNFSLYAGPKELNQLKAVGARLDEAIDYGWFSWLAIPIVYLLQFFYSLISNYGVAIILMTLFIKLLLHPISKKSMMSMKAMQKLQPELKKLQEKFKDDKVRLQQETMALFKRNKANPAGGCLPMLLQFPVYIALYRVLWSSIELFHAPFFGPYQDLAAADPYYIMPILLGLFMVAQQKVMPSASADPAQKKMMMIMPVMFTGFMLFLPVGLVLYILVNTVTSVGQQWLYNNDYQLRDVFTGRLLRRARA